MDWRGTLNRKKAQLAALLPLPEALQDNLSQWLRVELTYTSNAIEGNTLGRQQTALVIEQGLTVGGKTLIEHLEARNHAAAFDWLTQQLIEPGRTITVADICHLHALLLAGIQDEHAGQYRRVRVRLSGSAVALPNPLKVPDLMADLGQWLAQPTDLHAVEYAIERAAEAHYRLVTIHPFIDGNGRSARLLMNALLMQAGYPAAIIRPRDRLAYIQSLQQAQLGGSQDAYIRLIASAVERGLDHVLRAAAPAHDNQRIDDAPLHADEALMRIGALAKRCDERPSTLRHWTQLGLLEVVDVTPAGYQLYPPEAVERVHRIRALQHQRLTLKEIAEQFSVNPSI